MRSQVQKWGNSLAVRIPKAFAADLGLDRNVQVDVLVEDGALVVRPCATPLFELKALLDQVEPENLHAEFDWGGPIGKEQW